MNSADDFDNDPNKCVTVLWHNQDSFWWNETCAMVLEVFGLPGHRFIYTPTLDHMTFRFKTEADTFTCKLLLSDRL